MRLNSVCVSSSSFRRKTSDSKKGAELNNLELNMYANNSSWLAAASFPLFPPVGARLSRKKLARRADTQLHRFATTTTASQ